MENTPFGEEIFAGVGGRTTGQGYVDDSVRQQFTAYERDDETGLDYAQARYYASSMGRFVSVDPLMASARLANPKTWNRYTYSLNNPLRFVDPTGLFSQDKIKKQTPTNKDAPPCFPGCIIENPVWKVDVDVIASGADPIETTPAVLGTTLALRPLLAVPAIFAGVPASTVVAGAAGIAAGAIIGAGFLDAVDNPRQATRLGPGGQGLSTTAGSQATTGTTAIPLPRIRDDDRSGPLIVFHGTDANSANNIMANGLNVRQAMNLGGGDVFWTSTNVAEARIFAEVNPSGGSPAVLQIAVPRASADLMISQGTLVVAGSVHQFSRAAWPQLNTTAVFTRVQ